ncbi:hypothetical protein MMC25_008222 [Agyrium rufum]|nr:hypothetical protein [Agyrium rufum]
MTDPTATPTIMAIPPSILPTQTPATVTSLTFAPGSPSSTPIVTSDTASSLVVITSSPIPSATSTSSASSTSKSSGLDTTKIIAIVVPIVVVVAIIPLLYLWYIRRRFRKNRESMIGEKQQTPSPPPEKEHLRSDSANSMTLPTTFQERDRVTSEALMAGNWDQRSEYKTEPHAHEEDQSRAPSPVLPSPSMPTFRHQEQWPLTAPLPEPPAIYRHDDNSIRAPSSHYGSQTALRPSESTPRVSEDRMVSPQDEIFEPDLTIPPTNTRMSDAISELSFDSRSRRHRTKSLGELSAVSALEEDELHEPEPPLPPKNPLRALSPTRPNN